VPVGQHDFSLNLDSNQGSIGRSTSGSAAETRRESAGAALATVEMYQSDEFEFEQGAIIDTGSANLNAELSDAELADEIDQEVAAELGAYGDGTGRSLDPDDIDVEDVDEDLPFDPEEAKAFDAGVKGTKQGLGSSGNYSAPPNGPSIDFELGRPGIPVEHDVNEDSDVFSSESEHQTVTGTDQGFTSVGGDTRADLVATDEALASDAYQATARSSGNLEDDLEEAEFFVSQSMYGDAVDLLRGMLVRYPNHPLVAAKLSEVELMVSGSSRSVSADLGTPVQDAPAHQQLIPGITTEGIDLADLEELDEELEEVNDDDDDDLPNERPRPGVMLENPIEDGDVSTHYDLGLAYKEMGLYDDAIKAFEKVLRSRAREVQCRLMLGMCHRDQNNPSEAVNQFKQALHAPTLTELERQMLYYEIGVTYEIIGDKSEALYYLQMVLKRVERYADAAERVERLKR
jgi:tetratricopeptide (TPR) repeat protein